MKKPTLLLFLVLFILACNHKSVNRNDEPAATKPDLTEYKYKVSGVTDPEISDSIWKMMFKVPGIEEMYIDKKDTTLSVKVDAGKISSEQIVKEVELRGGRVLKTLK